MTDVSSFWLYRAGAARWDVPTFTRFAFRSVILIARYLRAARLLLRARAARSTVLLPEPPFCALARFHSIFRICLWYRRAICRAIGGNCDATQTLVLEHYSFGGPPAARAFFSRRVLDNSPAACPFVTVSVFFCLLLRALVLLRVLRAPL